MKIIAITNQKGGVGKTTTATALATGLTREGYKVLMVDMDPQSNTTDTFRALIHNQATLYDVLVASEPIASAIQHTDIGDILAGDPLLVDAEQIIAGQGREHRLREAFEGLPEGYDYVIIDTPPNLGVLLTNALTAADSVIIPIVADRYTFQGLNELDKTIARVRKYSNPRLRIDGLLLVKNDPRKKLSKEAQELLPQLCKDLGTRHFTTFIREAEAVRQAQKRRVSLFTLAPDSTAAADYEAFIDEYLRDSVREVAN